MPKQTSIAKITRPRLPEILPRPRLFRLLDECRKTQVTWISGPGGSGKTTLVASYADAKKLPCLWYQLDAGDSDTATFFYYMGLAAKKVAPRFTKPLPLLTPEYLRDIPTFTRRYFESLCLRLPPRSVIVFDNYHDIDTSSLFHTVLREALAALSDQVTLIVASRGAPPSTISLLRTYGTLGMIGEGELNFTVEETGALLDLGKRDGAAAAIPEELQRATEGWAAGLVLLIERMRAYGNASSRPGLLGQEAFFEYFATELFDKADPATQDFLLKTSFLPGITPPAATALTGNGNAGPLLASLARANFFTERRRTAEPIYQYHPLFREFLMARARDTYPEELWPGLLRSSATLCAQGGRPEDAADLYRQAGAWDEYALLVLENAPTMVSQGRTGTLEVMIRGLPAEHLERRPWLIYWMAVCRMPHALLEGRRQFETALELFRKQGDASGAFLAWSGVAESIIQELGDLRQMDPCIEQLDELMREFNGVPSPLIEAHVTARIFMSMSLRCPWHPSFGAWRRKALALLEGDADANIKLLAAYYLFTHFNQVGDSEKCSYLANIIKRLTSGRRDVSPLAYTMGKMAEAWQAWTTCSYEQALKAMEEGLDKSRETGVHLWDPLLRTMGMAAALSIGDYRLAEDILKHMAAELDRARPLEKVHYYHMAAWLDLYLGNRAGAASNAETAIELARKIAFLGAEAKSRFAMAHVKRVTGAFGEAREQIALCREIGRRVNSGIIEFDCRLTEAAVAFAEDDEQKALRRLREAMSLGREKGYVAFNYIKLQHREHAFLCVKALEAGIEVDFAREMVRKRNLVPEEPPLHIERWPWPVRIYTLGRFALAEDGKPIHFPGKVQKKPLEMLKVLIALGGSEVREDQLMDALWPEAEGDAASASYRTTLHRLRQLIGNEKAITAQEGRVNLDPRYCWVDAWAFERAMKSAESGVRKSNPKSAEPESEIIQHIEQALQLYRGHFLAGEDWPWAISLREKMKNKFLRTVELLGSCRMAAGQPNKARECYERGLEIDDLTEEFYRGLMACNLKLGKKAEAIKVYKRCKEVLTAGLGVGPSFETEMILRSVRE